MKNSTQTTTLVKTKTVSATKFAIAITCLGLAALAAAAATARPVVSKSCTSNKLFSPPLLASANPLAGKPVTVPVCVGDKIYVVEGIAGEEKANPVIITILGFDEKQIHLSYFNGYALSPEDAVKEFKLDTEWLNGTAYGLMLPLFPNINNDTGDPTNNFLQMSYKGVIKYAQNKLDKGKLWLRISGPANETTCVDSDVGKTKKVSTDGVYTYVAKYMNPDVKGKVTGFGVGQVEEYEDKCIEVLDEQANTDGEKKYVTKLLEFYCHDGFTNIQSSLMDCQFSCEDGRCLSATEFKEKTEAAKNIVKLSQEPTWFKNKFGKDAEWKACVDTDEIADEESENPDYKYWNPEVKGVGKGWTLFGEYVADGVSDQCLNDEKLIEVFCETDTDALTWMTTICENGCSGGVCKK